MKKLVVLSMGILLAMSLLACGESEKNNNAATNTQVVTDSETADDTANVAVEDNEEVKPVEEVNSNEEITDSSENDSEVTTEQSENLSEATTEQGEISDEEMLTEEEANQALTNYIYEVHGEDFGEDLPEGVNCYWFVGELEDDNTYTGELHSYTGVITYFYIDAYTGETEIYDYLDFLDEPEFVETVNFRDYL